MNTGSSRASDEAVSAATGRRWREWFAILDAEGAARMEHARIARLVREGYDASHWWAQTIAVEYERERGLREVNQAARGYQVSVSRTIPASAEELFGAWEDERRRFAWLRATMKVRKVTPNISMRLETGGAGSDLSVHFYPKDESRCQVVIQQIKLPDRAAVESQRAFWKGALSRLGVFASHSRPREGRGRQVDE